MGESANLLEFSIQDTQLLSCLIDIYLRRGCCMSARSLPAWWHCQSELLSPQPRSSVNSEGNWWSGWTRWCGGWRWCQAGREAFPRSKGYLSPSRGRLKNGLETPGLCVSCCRNQAIRLPQTQALRIQGEENMSVLKSCIKQLLSLLFTSTVIAILQ